MKLSSWLWANTMVTAELNTGAMIALMAPTFVRQKLDALGLLDGPGAEHDNLHVTLAYLGPAVELSCSQLKKLGPLVARVASKHAPLKVKLGGLGKFLPKDDRIPFYATIDAPGLNHLQADLDKHVSKLLGPKSDHGWMPHMTLGYIPVDADHVFPDLSKELPSWNARKVSLVVADQQQHFDLLG